MNKTKRKTNKRKTNKRKTNRRKINFSKNGGTRGRKRSQSLTQEEGYISPIDQPTRPVNARPVRPRPRRRPIHVPASRTIPFPPFIRNQTGSPKSVADIEYGGNNKKYRKRKMYGKGLAASKMIIDYMDEQPFSKPSSSSPPRQHYMDRSLSSPQNDIESLGSMNKLNRFNPIKTSFNNDNNSITSSYDSLASQFSDYELDNAIRQNEFNENVTFSHSPLGYVGVPRTIVTQREYSPLPPGKEFRSVSAPTYSQNSPSYNKNNRIKSSKTIPDMNTYLRTLPQKPITFGAGNRKSKKIRCKKQIRKTRKFI